MHFAAAGIPGLVAAHGSLHLPLRFKSLGDEGRLSTKTYETTNPLPPPVGFRYESTPGGSLGCTSTKKA